MPTALVSGSHSRAKEVARELVAAGYDCLTVGDVGSIAQTLDAFDVPLDSYVQMPVDISGDAHTAAGRLRELLTSGLIARCQAVELVLDAMADHGHVVLVGGNRPREPREPDNAQARYGLLRVLGRAVAADCTPRGVDVVVLPDATSVEDIVHEALGHPTSRYIRDADTDLTADWFTWFEEAIASGLKR